MLSSSPMHDVSKFPLCATMRHTHTNAYTMPCAFYVTIGALTQATNSLTLTVHTHSSDAVLLEIIYKPCGGNVTNTLMRMTTDTIHDAVLTNRCVCLCGSVSITTPIHSSGAADSVVSKTMRVWKTTWKTERESDSMATLCIIVYICACICSPPNNQYCTSHIFPRINARYYCSGSSPGKNKTWHLRVVCNNICTYNTHIYIWNYVWMYDMCSHFRQYFCRCIDGGWKKRRLHIYCCFRTVASMITRWFSRLLNNDLIVN